jgi:hypothetical protein
VLVDVEVPAVDSAVVAEEVVAVSVEAVEEVAVDSVEVAEEVPAVVVDLAVAAEEVVAVSVEAVEDASKCLIPCTFIKLIVLILFTTSLRLN